MTDINPLAAAVEGLTNCLTLYREASSHIEIEAYTSGWLWNRYRTVRIRWDAK